MTPVLSIASIAVKSKVVISIVVMSEKHTSLFGSSLNYSHKNFITLVPDEDHVDDNPKLWNNRIS
jgi:hypothetical protein